MDVINKKKKWYNDGLFVDLNMIKIYMRLCSYVLCLNLCYIKYLKLNYFK